MKKQPDETYNVRLMFEVPAQSHEDAISKTLDQLARYGFIDWVYRSQHHKTGEVAWLNGDLEPIDIEGMAREAEEKQRQERLANEALARTDEDIEGEREVEDVDLPGEEE